MVKRRIPGVEVGPLQVDTDSYPSLGQEQPGAAEARSAEDLGASPSVEPDAAPAAEQPAAEQRTSEPPVQQSRAPQPRAPEPEPAKPSPARKSHVQAAQTAPPPPPPPPAPPQRAGGEGRSAFAVAAVAGLLSVVALGTAWYAQGEVPALRAAMSEAGQRFAGQAEQLRQSGAANEAAVEALIEGERAERRALAANLAILHLGAAVRSGVPFVEELRLSIDLLADDPAAREHLSVLAGLAEQGVAPSELLRESFSQAVLQPARSSSASLFSSISGLFDRMLPNGATEAPRPLPMMDELRRAEQSLRIGDLQTALVAVRPHAADLPNAQQWLAVAEERFDAERALSALEASTRRSLARLAD